MDWTQIVVSFWVGVAATLLARPLVLGVGGVLQGLFSDIPRVSGSWKAEYKEPVEGGGARERTSEELELRQFGRLVWGTGSSVDGDGMRVFRYKGRVVRATLVATYKGKGSKSPVGSGALQVKINDSMTKMVGWCTWHDFDTELIESSDFAAEKRLR